jgi:hypothetical protein
MSEERDQAMLEALRDIRDGQRAILEALNRQNDLARDHFSQSRATIAQSIELQRTGLRRFRAVSVVAVPGIVACIAAIVYLVVRYF